MKTMRKIGSFAMLLGCAGTVWAAGWPQSSRVESAKPTIAGASVTLAEPYKILLTRSIFSRDGRAQLVLNGGGQPKTHWPTPSTTQSTQPAVVWHTPDPEAGYVLRGVGMEDGVFTAFFEQTTESKGYLKHVGDIVARGKIMAISLDGIDYQMTGKVSRIIIGQALDGHMAPVAASVASGAGSEKTSRWIRHDTPGATPPGAFTGPAASGAEQWRGGGDQSRNSEQRGSDSRFNKERSRDGRDQERSRSGDQERSRTGDQERPRGEGPQGPETTERPDARPTEHGPQGPGPGADHGPGPEVDELPVVPIFIDPN